MATLRFQTGGRHQNSPGLPSGDIKKRKKKKRKTFCRTPHPCGKMCYLFPGLQGVEVDELVAGGRRIRWGWRQEKVGGGGWGGGMHARAARNLAAICMDLYGKVQPSRLNFVQHWHIRVLYRQTFQRKKKLKSQQVTGGSNA